MKKNGFSLNEHRKFGKELESIRNNLNALSVEIYNSYPRSQVSDKLYDAVKFIDKVRSELDDQLLRGHPELSIADFQTIYYGNRPEGSSERGADST
jgi:hypothetical protein